MSIIKKKKIVNLKWNTRHLLRMHGIRSNGGESLRQTSLRSNHFMMMMMIMMYMTRTLALMGLIKVNGLIFQIITLFVIFSSECKLNVKFKNKKYYIKVKKHWMNGRVYNTNISHCLLCQSHVHHQ